MTTPLSLPRLSAAESQALNAIAGALRSVPVRTPDAADPALLSVSSLGLGAEAPAIADTTIAGIEWAGARFQLEVPTQAIEAWTAQSLGTEVSTLPAAWRDAALTRGLGWLCDALGALGRGRARCVSLETRRKEPLIGPHRLLVQLLWPESGRSLAGMIHADGLGLLVCASLAGGARSVAGSSIDLNRIPYHLALCLGETDLPAGRLNELGPGDVILITEPCIDGHGRIALHALGPEGSAFMIAARLDDLQITLTDTPRPMTTPSIPAASEVNDDSPVALDRIPIRLSFDVGSKALTLAELQALQPGTTFTLDRPPKEYVTIRANGSPIGTGYLVDIDGRLGVSVTSLAAPQPTPDPTRPTNS